MGTTLVSTNTGSVDNTYWSLDTEFRWKLRDFCCMRSKKVGDCIRSPKFVTRRIDAVDLEWFLDVYPKGHNDDLQDYIALFLYCTSLDSEAEVTFIILNNEGEAAVTRYRTYEGRCKTAYFGFKDFTLRSFIQNPVNGVLNNNELTILCKIKIKSNSSEFLIDSLDETEDQQVEEDILSFHENIYETLLDDSKFSDVVLTAEGKTVKVYKGILAKSSPVFASMFENEMKEKLENAVEITDIKYDVLMELLRFVYVGKVNNIDTLVGELAIAADKYALYVLKSKCEKTMMKNLTVDNAIQCLQLADSIRMNELKENAIDFVVKNATVTEKPEFHSLPCDLVVKICQTLAKKCMLV